MPTLSIRHFLQDCKGCVRVADATVLLLSRCKVAAHRGLLTVFKKVSERGNPVDIKFL